MLKSSTKYWQTASHNTLKVHTPVSSGIHPRDQTWCNICKSINLILHINKRKDKNHMTIAIDAEKTFDKVQHPFMIKTISKVRVEGVYLNMIMVIYEKP